MVHPFHLLLLLSMGTLGQAQSRLAAHLKTDNRIALYEKMAKTGTQDSRVRLLLASAYLGKMRETSDYNYVERAAKIVGLILERDAGNYEARRLRNEIELYRHNFDKVAEYSLEMTRIAPDDPSNWATLGDAWMEKGQYDRAAEAYENMLKLRPGLASFNRAAFYRFVTGDAEGAIEAMKKAVAAGGSSAENVAWCLAELGQMQFKTGRTLEAAASFSEALRIFPGYHAALAGVGRVRASQGQNREAIESYKAAQRAVPLPEYAAALYELYQSAGAPEDARRQMEMVDVIDKIGRASNEKTNRMLALIYADHDRNLPRALELARAEMEVRQDVYSYDALAWALYKNGRFAEAEIAGQRALKLGTPEPSFYYHAGLIAEALGKHDQARKHLERALALNPQFDLRHAKMARDSVRMRGLVP